MGRGKRHWTGAWWSWIYFANILKTGGKKGGPNRKKSAWVVHEPQILPLTHTQTPPSHLQLGRVLGTCPVLTAPSHSQKTGKVAPHPPHLEVIPDPGTL
jgi:hypothetical protein